MPIVNLKNKIDKFSQVDISIRYNLGGIKYFNYKNEARGYYIHFSPCNSRQDKYGLVTEYEIFHEKSFKYLIKEVKRQSIKVHKELNDLLSKNIDVIVNAYEKSNQKAVDKVVEIFGDK